MVLPLESCRPLFERHKLLILVGLYVFDIGMFVRKHPYYFEKASYTASKIGKLSRDPTKPALLKNRFQKELRVWLIKNIFYTINEFL